MGAYGDVKGNKKPVNAVKGDARKAKYDATFTPSAATWADAQVELVGWAITRITDNGDAILFGKSRDSGVLSVTWFESGDRRKFYPRDAEEIRLLLVKIGEFYDS